MIYFREIEMSSVGPLDGSGSHYLSQAMVRYIGTSPQKKGQSGSILLQNHPILEVITFQLCPKPLLVNIGLYMLIYIYAYNAYICLHVLIYI